MEREKRMIDRKKQIKGSEEVSNVTKQLKVKGTQREKGRRLR